MNRLLVSLSCLVFCVAYIGMTTPALAQVKDSYFFMRDDGEQSPEEMEEEAQYVFQTCANNTYQARYFNCECVAGAFLQKREKYGGVAPQEELLDDILSGKNAQCANTIEIAGEVYSECRQYARTFREYKKDNEEYCTCVGNTVAKKFSKQPFLRTTYIRHLRTDAMVACTTRDDAGNPQVRP